MLALAAPGLPTSARHAEPPAAVGPPSFAADIAPILATHCIDCHRPGGDAPFPLLTFDDVRYRAATIAAVTTRRIMPPWKPAPGIGDFAGARRLSDAQLDTLRAWAEAGAPEGPPGPLPPPPPAPGWLHGPPDLIVTLAPYTLRADGGDVFRNFVVTVPGTGRRYVRGLQFRPGSPAVHHANIRVDPTPASRRLDAADEAAGYEGLILRSAQFPGGHFLGWTPGQAPPLADGDMVWPLDGGTDLVVQLHLRPIGRRADLAPQIGLYFTDTPPRRTPTVLRLGREDLAIPAAARDYGVTDAFTLPVAVDLHAIQPHAHYRARTFSADATLPDGTRRSLLRIDDWDFNWQDQYRYRSPIALPAGTRLAMAYRFDNSAENPRNPTMPPQPATWGWRSSDEMADVWLQLLAHTDADRQRLQHAVDRHMLSEDVVGGERVLEREPDHVALRNDTALAYMELGRSADALRHFAVVTRLTGTAAAWFNEGVALEAMGQIEPAAQRYATAIKTDPDYAAAHNNLGSLRVRQGQFAAARADYEAAIRADAGHADARANLALVLAALHEPDAALAAADQVLSQDPDRLTRLTPLVWLLVAAHDPADRRAAEGLALARRIAGASEPPGIDALDALAAALGATGAYAEAVATASRALDLALAIDPDQSAPIRARLDLYRAGKPFVLP